MEELDEKLMWTSTLLTVHLNLSSNAFLCKLPNIPPNIITYIICRIIKKDDVKNKSNNYAFTCHNNFLSLIRLWIMVEISHTVSYLFNQARKKDGCLTALISHLWTYLEAREEIQVPYQNYRRSSIKKWFEIV